MHGTVMEQLKLYVKKTYGVEMWEKVAIDAGYSDKPINNFGYYQQEEFRAFVRVVSRHLNKTENEVVEALGYFILPHQLHLYGSLLDPNWTFLEVLEKSGGIHEYISAHMKNVSAPKLVTKMLSDNSIEIIYTSEARMCPYIFGVLRRLAEHFRQKADFQETSCMLRGDPHCRFVVTTR